MVRASWVKPAAMGVAMLLAAALLLGLMADGAWAQAAASPVNCNGYVGVSNKIASCVLAALGGATGTFFTQFYPYVSEAITAVMVIGVAVYGVMIAFSMVENIGRDTIMLLIKIALVTYCTTNTDVMYGVVTSMMNAGGAAVMQTVPAAGDVDGSADFANITCLNNMRSASVDAGRPTTAPFLAIDCMIDTVIGIKMPNADGINDASVLNPRLNTSNSGMSRGLLYFFASGMQTSMTGLILGLIGLLFIWSLLLLTIKSLLIFLSGYLAVAFLMIISPLFIPLVLLPGEGPKSYFDKWVKLLIGFGMQPVLMMVFVSLFISAVDLAMFSSDYSVVYRIAGDASRQQGFDINAYLQSHQAIKETPTTVFDIKTGKLSPQTQAEVNNSVMRSALSQCGQAAYRGVPDDPACNNVAPIKFFRNALDWQALADARSPAVVIDGDATSTGQQMAREVLSASIFCAVILYVMNRFASIVPSLISNVVGASSQAMQNVNLLGGSTGSGPSLLIPQKQKK